jgi:predicted RNA-binding protein with PUA-like domain
MGRWLFKQEPGCYSYADLEKDRSTVWDGVRNPLAAKYLREVKKGDRIFFYHTGDDKAIVGEMKASDVSDGVVTVAPVRRLKQPVTLKQIKDDPLFVKWDLVRNSRLSVMPVSDEIWQKIAELAE